MIKLLLLRAVPLFFRPAAVLLEGAVVTEKYFLVMVMPVAMMALTISSVPIHLDYFKCRSGRPEYSQLARVYISSLSWLTLASLVTLCMVLSLIPLGLGSEAMIAICLVFLIEKLSDETSRILEFRKSFVSWFCVQSFRSGWLFFPIFASFMGLNYEVIFLVIATISCVFAYYIFHRVSGLSPCFSREGFSPIRDNLVFLVGSFLPSSYRQMPRILVAKIYPEQAHVFLAMAQLAQGIGLLFNVRFQIPYRRLIARRTIVFQRLVQPTMLRILVPSGLIAIVYLIVPSFVIQESLSDIALALLLAPIMISDALTFSILAAHLGYLPWFASKGSALAAYLLCLSLAAIVVSVSLGSSAISSMSILAVPAMTTSVGFAWLLMIKVGFFSRRKCQV